MRGLSKKGEMGMGTLIIFIAMVLVAAVAAAVLISTTGTLQNKALATGKATSKEVGTSINALQVYAEDGSNQNVEEFVQVVKLNAGSEAIRLSDLLLTLNLNNQSSDYEYSSIGNCTSIWTVAGGDYAAAYSITGPNNKAGYLTKGDVVKLCFEAPRSVGESEDVRLALIPKVGTPNVVEASLPELMVDKRIEIFP